MAHPGLAVVGVYKEPVNMWSGAAQGYETFGLRDTLSVKLESINVPPEVFASRLPGAGQRLIANMDRMPHMAAWSLAVRAEAEGTVRPSMLFGEIVRYTLTTRDLERVRMGAKKLAEMHFLAGATEVMPGINGVPESITSIDQIGEIDAAPLDPRAYGMIATHLFGTCRAGSDPKTSVVNEHLRVHGVEGLYVMDASIFPSNTGVNPQHSIMALSTVAAERLAAASGRAVAVPETVAPRQPEVAITQAAS
jgi:choline dehydrogenase-like flavoprotein